MNQQIQTLYPFHPVTGYRLCATVDYLMGTVLREILKDDGEILYEDGTHTDVDWNAAEEQVKQGTIYLQTEHGAICLESEAIWREDDVDVIEIVEVVVTTDLVGPNKLRADQLELASAAREVVLDIENGACPKAAAEQLKALMVGLGLWEEYAPEAQ